MYDEEYAAQRFGKASTMAPLVLPHVSNERHMLNIFFIHPLSKNKTDWHEANSKLPADVKKNYRKLSVDIKN